MKMYGNFTYDIPTKVLFGAGQLDNLHGAGLPGKKALIVTSSGRSVKKYGYLSRTEKQLDEAGIDHVLFDQVRPNPSTENVADGARTAKDNGCDFVVALGGGSVMDCAKCIALMSRNEGELWDYSLSANGGKKSPANPAAPIVAITTSAGTGSEVDSASVISNARYHEKTGIFFPSMYPTLAVVDPDLTMSVPEDFTAYQGMDAFFHATESMVNTTEHPVGEMFATKAIEYVAEYLPRAVEDGSDKEARGYMALANTLAGFYMLCTSEHTMEHVMGSYHDDLVHGAGLIMISHEYFGFFAERKAAEGQMVKMARAMGVKDPTGGKDFMDALDKLISDVGCSELSMRKAGITREELKEYPAKVHEVIGGNIDADPLHLSDADYYGIYQRSFDRA